MKRKKIMTYRNGGVLRKAGFGGFLKTISPFANLIPGAGPALSVGLNAAGTVLGGIEQSNKFKKSQQELERKQEFINEGVQFQNDRIFLDTFPTSGVEGASFKGALGGRIPTRNISGGNAVRLSSDAVQFDGATHNKGGIKLNPNIEVEDEEVLSEDRIFSNRLKVPDETLQAIKSEGLSIPSNKTFAETSAFLEKLKGKFELKADDLTPAVSNTGRLMTQKIDDALERLFSSQERVKPSNAIDEFSHGGSIKKKFAFGNNTDPNDPFGSGKSLFGNKRLNFDNTSSSDTTFNEFLTPNTDPFLRNNNDPFFQRTSINGLNFGNKKLNFGNIPSGNIINNTASNNTNFNNSVLQNRETSPNLPNIFNNKDRINSLSIGNTQVRSTIPTEFNATSSPNFFNNNNASGINKFANRFGGDILNAASTFANDRLINSLNTEITPSLEQVPRDTFIDRSGLSKNENAIAARTAVSGLRRIGRDTGGARANILTENIKNNSRINQGENLRRDRFDERLRREQFGVNARNTNTINRTNLINQESANAKIGLKQANLTNFTQSAIGNQVQRDNLNQGAKALAIRALESNDMGDVKRFMNEFGFNNIKDFIEFLQFG